MAIGSYNLAVLIFEMNYSALPGSVDYLVIANSYYSSSLPFTSLYFPRSCLFALIAGASRRGLFLVSLSQKKRTLPTVSRMTLLTTTRFLT